MVHHFEHLVTQLSVLENATHALGSITMFSPKDRDQILSWNAHYPEIVNSTVPLLFAEQVRRRPDALAVDAWDGRLTYAQLDAYSTALAHHLHYLGVGPEMLVPMFFDKSRWAVVAQISVMKAGGACVNLDPKHPQERLKSIVRDAGALVVLVAPEHAEILDADQSDLNARQVIVSKAFIQHAASSTELMKELPTSYSPPFQSPWRAMGHRTGNQIAAVRRYTFDMSCADIFTTLQQGGCICVPSEHDRLNALAEAINHFQCNWAFLTPTVASLLPAHDIPSLRTLGLGGEASTRDTIAKWHSMLDLIVCYGPAECSVYCSGMPPATATSDPANLGAAIGALYWIADPQNVNQLMPVGCVGELLLEGPTIAREYLHDPEKTAGAFIRDPVWAQARDGTPRVFYRTGDLVRYNEDGTIRFVGRKDTQVKVRGQRVELGEVEHAVRNAMPALAHATVDAVRDPDTGRQEVVAILHFSNRSGEAEVMELTPELREQLVGLQQTLRQSLPSYMIPSLFIPLARVPLTMNGKADRKQLRELALSLSRDNHLIYALGDGDCVRKEPSTATEFQLRELWAKALQMDAATIGTGDHFFRVGGDSIIAMKLAGLARTKGWHVSVQEIFGAPVLSDMVTRIDQGMMLEKAPAQAISYKPFSLLHEVDDITNLVASVAADMKTSPQNIADVLPTTDFQASAITHSMMRTRGLVNYLFLDGEGEIPWTAQYAQKVWTRFLDAHQILRTAFWAHNDRFYQVVLRSLHQQVEWHETGQDLGIYCDGLCRRDLTSSDLRLGGPLAKLIVIGNGECHRLILRMSHAQYDGVCLPQIWRTLQAIFSNQPISPEVPFAQYVTAIDAQSSKDKKHSLTYWQTLLSDSKMTNVVSKMKPDYRNVYDLHLTRRIAVPSTMTSSELGFTFATILKAAWASVLSFLSGSTDVVFGHVTSGRNIDTPASCIEPERIIGACLNISPFGP
ncbi:hypothetical protein BDW67DRAFT_189313 [Aspergillus spinulosporus]